ESGSQIRRVVGVVDQVWITASQHALEEWRTEWKKVALNDNHVELSRAQHGQQAADHKQAVEGGFVGRTRAAFDQSPIGGFGDRPTGTRLDPVLSEVREVLQHAVLA